MSRTRRLLLWLLTAVAVVCVIQIPAMGQMLWQHFVTLPPSALAPTNPPGRSTTSPGQPTATNQPTVSTGPGQPTVTSNSFPTAVSTPIPNLPPPDPAQVADFAQRVIARTNMYRAQFGCPALTQNAILMGTAAYHSEDMARYDFVGHQSHDGTSPWDRIKQAGYNFSIVAENVAWGQTSPEQVVDVWFNETPPNDLHRQNILNCKLQDIGLGYYYLADDPGHIQAHTYWTQDFGTSLK